MKQAIFISESVLPPTTNEIIDTARRNRYGSADVKAAWTLAIADAFRATRTRAFKGPVHIEYIWTVKNLSRDEDNTTGAQKYINDGLVESGLVEDDNLRVIVSPVTHWFRKGHADGFTLFVYDDEAWALRLKERATVIRALDEDMQPPIEPRQLGVKVSVLSINYEDARTQIREAKKQKRATRKR